MNRLKLPPRRVISRQREVKQPPWLTWQLRPPQADTSSTNAAEREETTPIEVGADPLSVLRFQFKKTPASFKREQWNDDSLKFVKNAVVLVNGQRTNTNCIKICIQNLLKIINEVPAITLAQVAVSVFSFVKDSYSMSPWLLTEFEHNDGYKVLQAILFRDSGLLELLLLELRKEAKVLRKAGVTVSLLSLLTVPNCIKNLVFLRDKGMVPYIKIFLDDQLFRNSTLCILEQLSVVNPEEYMSTVIGALCTATEGELHLKRDLLQSLLLVLETPKGWCAFRTAGGFNGLLSLIMDMEGALSVHPSGLWATVDPEKTLHLILLTFQTIATAIHLDLANNYYFKVTDQYEKMAEALRLLGCFSQNENWSSNNSLPSGRTFFQFVGIAANRKGSVDQMPLCLQHCVKLLYCLDKISRGIYQNVTEISEISEETVNGLDVRLDDYDSQHNTKSDLARYRKNTVELRHGQSGDLIYHPGAIHVIMTLIPLISCKEDTELAKDLQCAVADRVQSIVKSERNRQIMCESGLLETILTHCQMALCNPADPFHLSVTRIFEKLASQAIGHNLLRCLFLPSLATVKGVNSDSVATGGHGIDCRAFPPATGLSFSIWFMVGKFSSISDAHPVRLFTVIRHMSRMSFHYVCLSVSISAPDNILVISTEEEIFQYLGTPLIWRKVSSLSWRLGPAYLFDEAISQETVKAIDKLGPNYIGNFQAVIYSGVRSFVSQTAANSFLFVGGPAVILGFVAIASDDSSMYTAMKILLSVITTSPAFEREMSRIQGYKIWKTAPDNLEYAVLTHFDDLLKSTSLKRDTCKNNLDEEPAVRDAVRLCQLKQFWYKFKVNLDSVLESLIESIDEKEKVCLCVNMAVVLFGMVKAILSKSDTGTEESWENLCPGSIMKFFCLIHNIFPRDKLWSTPRFLEALADTIFPCSSQQVYLASSGQVSSVLSEDSCNQETVSIDYSHPGRKQVCNFMRILLMDSLINITAQKQHPYEVILEHSTFCRGFYLKFNPVEETRGLTEGTGLISGNSTMLFILLNWQDMRQDVDENGLECNQLTFFPSLNEIFPSGDFSEQCTETQVILQELSEFEQINIKLSVAILKAHVIAEGVLMFGKADFYICENFTLSDSNDVFCKIHHPSR
ncbi:WDFY4 protein, partial [Polypterus senegalus]